MQLGDHHLCLTVKDLAAAIDFYTKLGFNMLEDPDGNVIFFNTFPSERELFLKTGRVNEEK